MTIQDDLKSPNYNCKCLIRHGTDFWDIDIPCGVSLFDPIKGPKPEMGHVQLHLPLTKATPPMHNTR